MQENEFERNVQESMESFELHPSDNVWQNLEKDLKERKKRRFLFLLLFSAVLLIGGGAAYYMMNANRTVDVQTAQALPASPVTNNAEDKVVKINGAEEKKSVHNDKIFVQDSASIFTPEQIIDTKKKESDIESNTIIPAKEKRLTKQIDTKKNRTIPKEKQAFVAAKKTDKIKAQSYTEETTAGIAENKINNTAKELEQQTESTVNDKADETRKAQEEEIINAADSIAKDSLALSDTTLIVENKPIKKTNQASKIRWAIDISGGINSSHGKAFSFQPQSFASAFRDQQATFAGLPQRRLPSAIKSGTSFTIGLAAEINISARSSIVISPLYKYASELIKIGDTINVVGNGIGAATNNSNNSSEKVYESGGNNSYTNTYHNAGVAVQYQWQVYKGKKVELIWNAGITPLLLLSTNALVYDTAFNGIYYRNKNAFRKYNINASTGFYFKFGNNMQWAIGPQFSFQMASLMKKDIVEPKRFQLYSGMAARFYLPKNR